MLSSEPRNSLVSVTIYGHSCELHAQFGIKMAVLKMQNLIISSGVDRCPELTSVKLGRSLRIYPIFVINLYARMTCFGVEVCIVALLNRRLCLVKLCL